MEEITVYTKPKCSGCEALKNHLKKRGIDFQELDGTSAVGLSALRCAGCFPMYYPVLQVGERIYEWASLFDEKGNLLDLTEVLNATG